MDDNTIQNWMEAFDEVSKEGGSQLQPTPDVLFPTIQECFDEIGKLPREAIFLGVASDGLPTLLNLHDAVPGPLLVVGDGGSGKTNFLRVVASGIGLWKTPEDVQFGVVTGNPDEWSNVANIPNCVGIFPSYNRSAEDFILSLASWAHGNKKSNQSVVLLLDDLVVATAFDFDTVQNLRWMLLRGPARRVWPIVTLNAGMMEVIPRWMEAFRTKIFGGIKNSKIVDQLNAQDAELNGLVKGAQFTLKEGDGWLRFWIPSL